MPLVFEIEQFISDPMFVKRFDNGIYVLWGEIGILPVLDDEQLALDNLDEVKRRAPVEPFWDLIRPAAHHLGTVQTQVRAGGLVVDHQVSHTAYWG